MTLRLIKESSDAEISTENPAPNQTLVPSKPATQASWFPDEQLSISLFENARHSVVHIAVIYSDISTSMNPASVSIEPVRGSGTGFFFDSSHVVTNFHVVKEAKEIRVRFLTCPAGVYFLAEMLGADYLRDIAVLKLHKPDFPHIAGQLPPLPPPLPLGKSSELRVGQRVFLIGNPFGLELTLTTGIISGLGREISSGLKARPMFNVIQTDASMNAGMSGCPVLDSRGYVIGCAVAIASTSGSFAGIGFAIPIDSVKRAANQIFAIGRVREVYMGIAFAPDAISRRLGVDVGLMILNVIQSSPASKVGIRGVTRNLSNKPVLGDILLAVDGICVNSINDVFRVLEEKQVGDVVTLTIHRDGEDCQFRVELEEAEEANQERARPTPLRPRPRL